MSPPTNGTEPERATAAYGYGDANADFHVVGDRPGVHGGETTGVPFTETVAGRRLQRVVYDAGLASEPYSDEPTLSNIFLSYVYMPTRRNGNAPTQAEYDDLERFFDAELRAINAHILLPVGERATEHVLREYTTQLGKVDLDVRSLHAAQLRGRGFLVVPIRDPAEWESGDETVLIETLEAILASDYRQTKGVATTVG